jgi:predicted RecB family nuclease
MVGILRQMRDEDTEPPLILNDHCPACEFRDRCHAQALRDDNLSLLRGIGAKEIRKLARKGILTVTQLSHTFRPRRKGKRGEPGAKKRHHSLQAMAVRDKTIYVLGQPQLPTNQVQVFLDIESDPEQQFVYLIGMIVVVDGIEQRFSFWADPKPPSWSHASRRSRDSTMSSCTPTEATSDPSCAGCEGTKRCKLGLIAYWPHRSTCFP